MNENAQNRFFLKLLQEIGKKIFIIIIAVVVGIFGGLAYCYFLDMPTYTATKTVMLVTNITSNDNGQEASNDVTLSKIYLTDVSKLISTPIFVNDANDIYKDDGGIGSISAGSIKVDYNSDSLIFNISYTDTSTTHIKKKLNAVIESAKINLTGQIMASTPTLLDMQVDPIIKTNKNILTDVILGALVGAVIGLAIIVLLYALDNTIRDKEEFEKITGALCLSHIELLSEKENNKQ